MADLDLGPAHVRAVVPTAPAVQRAVLPAAPPRAAVVPVVGSQGPPGPTGEDGSAALGQHIVNAAPHPAYDDIPSFTILFENGLI